MIALTVEGDGVRLGLADDVPRTDELPQAPPFASGEPTGGRRILKTDEDERLVYGVVMVADDEAVKAWKEAGSPDDGMPDVIDTEGEYVSEATLLKAHEGFMQRYAGAMALRGDPRVGREHDELARGVVMMQSAVLNKGTRWPDSDSEELTAARNWVVCDRILDDELWAAIKAEDITGYSIGGYASHAG